jgi:hypothetical protein
LQEQELLMYVPAAAYVDSHPTTSIEDCSRISNTAAASAASFIGFYGLFFLFSV